MTRAMILVLCLAVPYVFSTSFSNLQFFDDEGVLMIAFRDILDGRKIYHDSFALYGPFYYLALTPLFSIMQLPLSHDFARAVSAVFWLANSAVLGSFVYRLTASQLAGVFSLLAALFLLRVQADSPMHPQELSFLLIGALLHLTLSFAGNPAPAFLFVIGAIVGGLLLIKINLGLFIALPLILLAIRLSGNHVSLRWGHAVAMVAVALLPVVVMSSAFHFSWVILYCVFSTLTILSALVVWSMVSLPHILTSRHWGFAFAGFCSVAMATIGAVLTNGTSAFELLQGAVLQGAVIAQNWNIPLQLNQDVLLPATFSLIFAIAWSISTRLSRKEQIFRLFVRWLKAAIVFFGIAIIFITSLVGLTWLVAGPIMFEILLPFCWLIALVPASAPQAIRLSRYVVALIGSVMVLYGFPVASTQVTHSVLLLAVMLPVLAIDVFNELFVKPHSQSSPSAGGQVVVSTRNLLVILAYSFMLVMLVIQTVYSVSKYLSLEPLALRGASLIRAKARTVENYRWAVEGLSACQSFYTLPGLHSFYFWTNQKAPTGMSSNNTLGLLSLAQQHRMIADIEQFEDMCVLETQSTLEFYDRGQLLSRPPILTYTQENFIAFKARGPFRILKRKKRSVIDGSRRLGD